MADINIKNPKLRNYIRGFLNIEKFGEPFATLLEEAFVREVYVLDLTPEELLEDLNNFKNSIYYISWGECRDMRNVMGVTFPGEHRIEFKTSYWQNVINNCSPNIYCQKFFETFAHEVLHGMQNVTDGNFGTYNRAEKWNSQLNNRSHAIYEICTQGTAAKMANDRFLHQFNTNEILTGDGYSNEIFAIPLIASTFGVTEQEVLKYGMREREKLVQVLNKNIGNLDKTRELIDKIESQLEYLHSMHYPDENQKEFKDLSDNEKKKRGSKVIINLVDICQEALANRIINTPLDFNKDAAIKYKYDQKKIEDTLKHEIEIFGYDFKDDYITLRSRFEFSANAVYIKKAIEVFNEIGKDKNGKYIKYAPELIAAVKRNDFEYCMRAGIIQDDSLTYSLVDNAYEFKQKVIHDDYNDLKRWDNREIFNAIYPGLNIPFIENRRSDLNVWKNIYTHQGMQKMQDLAFTLSSHKSKYGNDFKEYLLSFIDTKEDEMESFYSKFTRQSGARDVFKRSFRTIEDKEFLARLIAENYIDRNFEQNGTCKQVATDEEYKIQSLFQSTIIKYGREQLIYAIEKIIINDEYDAVSSEQSRFNLCILGRKRIFDVISQPMLDKLLNQRNIIPEKNRALRNSIYQTNKKYPNSIQGRIARLVSEYKTTGKINTNLFTSNGRGELRRYFSGDSNRDMEDLIGLFLDSYADLSYLNYPNALTGIIKQKGKDYFRENMIRSILHDDYSGFTNKNEIYAIKNMSLENILYTISGEYIERAIRIGCIEESEANYRYSVHPVEIKPIAEKRRFGLFSKITDGLIDNKDKPYRQQNEHTFED